MSQIGGAGLEQITIDITVPDVEVINLDEAVIEIVSEAVVGPRGPQGIPGVAGPPGGHYTHTQAVPASVWTIQHNLGTYPGGVQAEDTLGNALEGLVTYPSINVVLLTLHTATAGVAYVS